MLKSFHLYQLLFLLIGFTDSLVAGDDLVPTRPLLVQAILSEGPAQLDLIGKLIYADDPVLVRDILTQWREGGVYVHVSADGSKVPFIIDHGKSFRIDSGLECDATETTPLDTDSKLRQAMRSTLNLVALMDPSPAVRKEAAKQLGMIQNPDYFRVFQGRLKREPSQEVRLALQEAMAMTQLVDADPANQIQAIQQLASLHSIASMDHLTKIGKTFGPATGEVRRVVRP